MTKQPKTVMFITPDALDHYHLGGVSFNFNIHPAAGEYVVVFHNGHMVRLVSRGLVDSIVRAGMAQSVARVKGMKA